MADPRPTVALVIPCYNEEDVLPETARQLAALLDSLMLAGRIGPASHVCFVDDGSSDATWDLIVALGASDPRFGGIRLSRNRGHQKRAARRADDGLGRRGDLDGCRPAG
jgi:glycosyltransferase involved in cell wall biosynthesis